MINQDIRDEVRDAGLKLWQIADGMGINNGNFSRKLRRELSPEYKTKIRAIIAAKKQEQKAGRQG